MNNINYYGVYEVGSSKKGILVSRSEGIQLRLRESRSKRIHKLHYNLDELRDLESKLVLITGRETKERKEVDLFLDVSYKTAYTVKLIWIFNFAPPTSVGFSQCL